MSAVRIASCTLPGVVSACTTRRGAPSIAGLGQVDHVAGPAGAGLGPKASLAVVRGLDAVAGATALRRPESHRVPADLTLVWPGLRPLKVARPHPAQHGNRGQRGDG